jgi:hypothetical protein
MPDDSPDGTVTAPETATDEAGTSTDEAETAAGDLGAATDDLRVAAVAAACTVGLTLALRYGVGRDVAFVYRLLPLGPYFLSLFADRLPLDGLDTPRNWSALTVAVTVGLFVYFGVL